MATATTFVLVYPSGEKYLTNVRVTGSDPIRALVAAGPWIRAVAVGGAARNIWVNLDLAVRVETTEAPG